MDMATWSRSLCTIKKMMVYDIDIGMRIHNPWVYPRAYDTSSTAQGGGGSFKNRKPIGEIGCCESGMAERIH